MTSPARGDEAPVSTNVEGAVTSSAPAGDTGSADATVADEAALDETTETVLIEVHTEEAGAAVEKPAEEPQRDQEGEMVPAKRRKLSDDEVQIHPSGSPIPAMPNVDLDEVIEKTAESVASSVIGLARLRPAPPTEDMMILSAQVIQANHNTVHLATQVKRLADAVETNRVASACEAISHSIDDMRDTLIKQNQLMASLTQSIVTVQTTLSRQMASQQAAFEGLHRKVNSFINDSNQKGVITPVQKRIIQLACSSESEPSRREREDLEEKAAAGVDASLFGPPVRPLMSVPVFKK